MIRKVSAELVPLTHALAKKVSTMSPLPGEREKKPARVKFFQNHINDGSFGSPTWSMVSLKDTHQEFRADGQHTSSVLAALPAEEFPKDLMVTLQRFEIDSVAEDGSGLFDMFDNPQSARTNTDAMGVHRSHFADLEVLASSFLVKVANGIDFYIKDLSQAADGAKLRYLSRQHGLYFKQEEHRRFALWLYRWNEAKYSWMIAKPGLVAEMLADWKASEQIATEFWGYVLAVNHPDVNHETRELAETLKEWASKSKYKQDKFRNRAKKVWERYRRLEEAERKMAKVA